MEGWMREQDSLAEEFHSGLTFIIHTWLINVPIEINLLILTSDLVAGCHCRGKLNLAQMWSTLVDRVGSNLKQIVVCSVSNWRKLENLRRT